MPRPPKCRWVCHFPQTLEFMPSQSGAEAEPVILTVDEYETIRLIDKEGLSQEQCSERMQVARTTAQKIYESARKKLADVLVDGRPLRIKGGAYQLCNGANPACAAAECHKQALYKQYQNAKGDKVTRIAVAYENGEIFQHFGRAGAFKVYDIQDGEVAASEVVSTGGSGHSALAELLHVMNVDALICGGIGGGAQMALASTGIRLYGGVSGSADGAVEALIAGELDQEPGVLCDHHDHAHGCH